MIQIECPFCAAPCRIDAGAFAAIEFRLVYASCGIAVEFDPAETSSVFELAA